MKFRVEQEVNVTLGELQDEQDNKFTFTYTSNLSGVQPFAFKYNLTQQIRKQL